MPRLGPRTETATSPKPLLEKPRAPAASLPCVDPDPAFLTPHYQGDWRPQRSVQEGGGNTYRFPLRSREMFYFFPRREGSSPTSVAEAAITPVRCHKTM